MRPFDPIENLYALLDLLLKLARVLSAPFVFIYHTIASFVFSIFDRNLEKLQNLRGRREDEAGGGPSRLTELTDTVLETIRRPFQSILKTDVRPDDQTGFWGTIADYLFVVLNVLVVEPAKVAATFAGAIYAWLLSRDWPRIALTGIPGAIMLLAGVLVSRGGQIERSILSRKYLTWATDELNVRNRKITPAISKSEGTKSELPVSQYLANFENFSAEDEQLPYYGKMLLNRVRVLDPSLRSQYLVGTYMIQLGAFREGQDILRQIAPDNAEGHVAAHGVLAEVYRYRIQGHNELELLPAFEHHAQMAMNWPDVSYSVLQFLSDLRWQRQEFEAALRPLEQAVKRFPELNKLLATRAAQAGDLRLANKSLQAMMIHLRAVLAANPQNEVARVEIADLLARNPNGLEEAAQILNEGFEYGQSALLSRAISEVYRLRYKHTLVSSQKTNIDLNMLDIALQADPTNAKVAEEIQAFAASDLRPIADLTRDLYKILISGAATVGTHAILAELNLRQDNLSQAIIHLEQVYALAPTAIRYAHLFASSLAALGRLDDAFLVASEAVKLLERSAMLKERYADDLLDTLGDIQAAKKEPADAVVSYERSLESRPNRLETRRKLIALYQEQGDVAASERHIQLLAEMERDDAKATDSTPQNADAAGQEQLGDPADVQEAG
ncbi:MAG: hypothetical protein KF752_08495 [Pirellulaceae bacterium]|nr:hypothetical protein [Pirellulaceae bacterium]